MGKNKTEFFDMDFNIKKIIIKHSVPQILDTQISSALSSDIPVLFVIDKNPSAAEHEIVTALIKVLTASKTFVLTRPIFIQTENNYHHSKFCFIKSENEIPLFYKGSIGDLDIEESDEDIEIYQTKRYLYQQKILQKDIHLIEEELEKFASMHKKIFNYGLYQAFLKKIEKETR